MKGKSDKAVIGILIVIVVLLALVLNSGQLASTQPITQGGGGNYVPPSGCDDFLLDSTTLRLINKYTQAASGNVDFELWRKGADTSNPLQSALVAATTSSGTSTSTNTLWHSCMSDSTNDLYLEGGSTYYDEKIADWRVVSNKEVADGVVYFGEKSDYSASPIGTITDFDTADKCNGIACASTTTLELYDSGTDTMVYNYTTGDGSFTLDMTIGNTVAQTDLDNVVMCFQDTDAASNGLEGNEVTSLSIQLISGTAVNTYNIEADWVQKWKEAAGTGGYVCIPFATKIAGARTGTYRFTFAVTDANWAAAEGFQICVDDNGGYRAMQYPSGNVKATASCFSIDSIA